MSTGAEQPREGQVPARVWSGTGLQVAGRVFGSLCTFAILALLARRIETAEFGRYTFYIGVFGVLDALSDFGTGQAAVRMTAGDRWALVPVLRSARRIRLAMSFVGLAALFAFTSAYDEAGSEWILVAALYPFTHALELTATVFKNQIAWKVPVAVRAFASATRLGLVVGLVFAGVEDAPRLVFATALGSGTANVLLHFLARRHVPVVNQPLVLRESVLRTALPLGLGSLAAMLYFHVDNLFVRSLCGDEQLAFYNGGVRLLSFLIAIAQLASATSLPWLVRRHAAGEAGRAIAQLGQTLFCAAALGAGVLVPHSAAILTLAFGEPFATAGSSFAWLLGAVATIHAGAMFVTGLVAVGEERRFLVVALVGLGVNLIGNALLVPRLGIDGAAIATLATEMTVAVLALVALSRAGIRPLAHRPWVWLVAPLLFALGVGLSSLAA